MVEGRDAFPGDAMTVQRKESISRMKHAVLSTLEVAAVLLFGLAIYLIVATCSPQPSEQTRSETFRGAVGGDMSSNEEELLMMKKDIEDELRKLKNHEE